MPTEIHLVTPTLAIGSWFCSGQGDLLGPRESAASDELWLQRTGAHIRRVGSRQLIADPAHVLVQRADEEFRTERRLHLAETGTSIRIQPALIDELGFVRVERRGAGGRALMESRSAIRSPHVGVLHQRLLRALRGGASLAAEELAIELVQRTLDAKVEGGVAVRRPQRELAGAVLSVLNARYAEPLRLQDIAAAVERSPFYVSRTFRQVVGVSIHRYLVRLRLQAAIDRIACGEVPLARVAADVGFSSHSHFSNAFRREFGAAPSVATTSHRPPVQGP